MVRLMSLSWGDVEARIASLTKSSVFWDYNGNMPYHAFGIPRGGAIVVGLARQQGILIPSPRPEDADIIIDDVIDSGATRDEYINKYQKPVFALVDKPAEGLVGIWVQFPWEGVGQTDVEGNIRRIIQAIGDDPSREDLLETPSRVVRSWSELFSGYHEEEDDILKWFNNDCDEMVILRDIEFWSTCEHHLLPFWGVVDIAYVPNGRVIGISKIARLVNAKSRRLQIQERLTVDIGKVIESGGVRGVAVSIRASHACIMARGVMKGEARLTTNYLGGLFRSDPSARAEFLGGVK